jgi:hypothetical protein
VKVVAKGHTCVSRGQSMGLADGEPELHLLLNVLLELRESFLALVAGDV